MDKYKSIAFKIEINSKFCIETNMMKYFKIRKEEDQYLEFELANVNISLANAIRRIILSEIEIVAIDEKHIEIMENTCPLHNEYIAHRLSLIPVLQEITNVDDLEFYVAKKHTMDSPVENEQSNVMEITTDNIQVFNKKTESWMDPRKVFDGLFLITKLNLNQKFLAKFKLSRGTAKEHSRWQCVDSIAYRYKVKEDLTPGQEYDKITLENERDWIKKPGSDDPQAFIFFMESLGQMDTKLIVQKAMDILEKKCQTFLEWVNREKNEFKWGNMLELEYEGEMHTLGNLISTVGLDILGEKDFIGYRIIHPMLNKFILRMKLDGDKDKNTHVAKLEGIVSHIVELVQSLKKEWRTL
jgi:DNA-directed RNA polymerase alpha subunit